jgi:hemerythrin superfamily protein
VSAAKHVTMPFGSLPAPDVVDLLVEQHMLIRDLFATVLMTRGAERREAFEELVRLLAVHETAEEEVVHPALRVATAGGKGIVNARLEEERKAKELLKQLDGMDTDDAAFLPMFLQLREAVISHALSEQRYEFNRIRQHLPTAQRATMRMLVKAAEATAPTHPHPNAQKATANVLFGPPLALIDRVRDAIRAARQSDKGTEDTH